MTLTQKAEGSEALEYVDLGVCEMTFRQKEDLGIAWHV